MYICSLAPHLFGQYADRLSRAQGNLVLDGVYGLLGYQWLIVFWDETGNWLVEFDDGDMDYYNYIELIVAV